MNFSEALDKLKEGCAISREGWNGKGMYIFGVKGDAVKWQSMTDTAILKMKILR